MRTTKLSLVVLSVIAIFMAGCTKETTVREEYNPNITLFGLWKISNNQYVPAIKYLNFSTLKVLSAYNENSGFKSELRNGYFTNESQLIADFYGYGSPQIFNYAVERDTLKISLAGQTVMTCVKANASEVSDWVTQVTATGLLQNVFTQNYQGIGYDGNSILVPDYSSGTINFVNPNTGVISSTLSSQQGMNTLEVDFAGSQYWTCINGYSELTRIKMMDGTSLGNSIGIGPWIYGIAYLSSTQIAVYSNNEYSFFMYNPTTNAVAFSKKVDNIYFRDMAAYNGKVYVSTGNMVYRMDPAGFVVEKAYYVSNMGEITGIASLGGGEFFVMSSGGTRMGKVVLN